MCQLSRSAHKTVRHIFLKKDLGLEIINVRKLREFSIATADRKMSPSLELEPRERRIFGLGVEEDASAVHIDDGHEPGRPKRRDVVFALKINKILMNGQDLAAAGRECRRQRVVRSLAVEKIFQRQIKTVFPTVIDTRRELDEIST